MSITMYIRLWSSTDIPKWKLFYGHQSLSIFWMDYSFLEASLKSLMSELARIDFIVDLAWSCFLFPLSSLLLPYPHVYQNKPSLALLPFVFRGFCWTFLRSLDLLIEWIIDTSIHLVAIDCPFTAIGQLERLKRIKERANSILDFHAVNSSPIGIDSRSTSNTET